jgi:hypothetical protein
LRQRFFFGLAPGLSSGFLVVTLGEHVLVAERVLERRVVQLLEEVLGAHLDDGAQVLALM